MPDLTLDQVVDQVFDAAPAAVEDTPAPAPVAETSPDAPAPDAPAAVPDPAPTPTPSAPADDALIDVTIDGKPTQMTLADLRKNVSLTVASTQRFQQAAEQRRAAEAEMQKARDIAARAMQLNQQLEAALRDPNKLAALYMGAKANTTGTPVADQPAPSQLDLASFQQQLMGQVDQLVQERLASVQQSQTAAAVEADLTSYTDALLKDHPVLSVVPGYADKVYEAVTKMEPQSIDQAKEWIALHVNEMRRTLDDRIGSATKQAAVAKAKAVTATERGGSPVLPTPTTYALDDPQRETAMLQYLNGLLDGTPR